ncbi:MAG: transcriptional regulator GcvA [Azospirillaceae bacterium]
MKQLPPLKALPAFEASARLLSFTRAAAELHVTQGAVSQQIRQLEDWLGVRLFQRLTRELRLTEAGRRYALEVRDALRLLEEATAALRAKTERDTITLSCMPSFAHKWLGPRLGRFIAGNPDLALNIHSSFETVELGTGAFDCAIRHGAGGYRGYYSEILLTEELTPLCSPGIAERLREPADLTGETLIRDYGTEWSDWLEAAGLAGRGFRWGTEFMDSSMAIQAAIDGHGVILGHTVLAWDDIRNGLLVKPFALAVPYDFAHWFVCPEGEERRGAVKRLRDWLVAEAATFPRPEVRLGRRPSPPRRPFG